MKIEKQIPLRLLHTSPVMSKIVAGKYKVTLDKSKPLTYEMAVQPDHIGIHKSFNSFNTFSSSGLYSEALILTSILVSSSSTLVPSSLNMVWNSLNGFWLLFGIIHPSSQLLLKKASSKGLLMLNGEKVLMLRAIFSSWFLVWLGCSL